MPLKRFMRSAVLGLTFLLSSCSPEKEPATLETLCLIDPINGLPTPLPSSLQNGLVLHQSFNTLSSPIHPLRTYDLSDNHHDGLIYGPTWDSNGGKYLDGAFTFDGIDDKITIPNSKDFSIATTGQLTISFWARFDQTAFTGEGPLQDYLYFLAKGSANNSEWAFRQYTDTNTDGRSNRISMYVFNRQGGFGAGSYVQEPIHPNEWIHFVGIINGNDIHLFRNGILYNTGNLDTYGIVPEAGTAPLTIGTRDEKSWFAGSIDELRMYNRALLPSEIQTLYTAQSCNQFFK